MDKNNLPLNEPGIVFDDEMNETPEASENLVLEEALQKKEPPKAPVQQPSVPQAETQDYDFSAPVQKPAPSEALTPSKPKPAQSNSDEEIEFVLEPDSLPKDIPTTPSSSLEPSQAHSSEVVAQSTELSVPEAEAPKANGRIGDRLIDMGLITSDQLNVAIQEKKISSKMIGEILVDLGFIKAQVLSDLLAEKSGFETFDPKSTIIDSEALAYIDKPLAIKHLVLPFSIIGEEILVAMADPYDVMALDILKKHIPKNLKIKPYVATPQVLDDAIDAAYGYANSISAILKELEGQDASELGEVAGLSEDEAYSHPLVRLVNALVFEAVKIGASDLHFEPEENFVRLRYRLDGVLSTVQILHKQHWNGVSQRLKIMASLNIADKLTPQDGRIQMNVGGRDVDFRVSSLPTVFGENIVMRVLDKQSSIMPLSALGFSETNKVLIDKSQKRPEGIIIVTGPTGSGKTTSLYSMLNEINSVDVNIQTLEDPVEYSLPMIRQTQIREGVLDFADGIRALLRQDPDIIFIGEIRDKTTAEMALQAAMTGHQVYTTLHTNDSFGALPRLFDLGMVPGMIAGNIISIFAQRLTRTLCSNCKESYIANEEESQLLGVTNSPEIFRARQGGCDVCEGQGYKGRVAVAEILSFDEEMDEVVARGGTKADIKDMALSKGFKNMRDDAMLKILEGRTTFEAVSKVVDITK